MIARLWCFRQFAPDASLQSLHYGGRRPYSVAAENFQCLLVGGWVCNARPRGNMRRVVPCYVGNDQCQHRRPAGRCKPATEYDGKMLSNGVDLLNWRTGPEQFCSDVPEIGNCYAIDRQ